MHRLHDDTATVRRPLISLMCLQLHTLDQLAHLKMRRGTKLMKRLVTRRHMCSERPQQMMQTAGGLHQTSEFI